jgi:hypothetical protein
MARRAHKTRFQVYYYKHGDTDSAFAAAEAHANIPVMNNFIKEFRPLKRGEENLVPVPDVVIPCIVVSVQGKPPKAKWRRKKVIQGYQEISMWLRTKGWSK